MTCGTSPEQEGYHQGIGHYHEFLKECGVTENMFEVSMYLDGGLELW